MTVDKSSVEVSIKVVMFSGDKRDWMTWEEKFLGARASGKGYKKVLMGEVSIPKSTEDESKLSEEQLLVKKMNEKVYSDMILSMDMDKAALCAK